MRKILALTIALLLIIGMAGIGTWTFFIDVETSTSNVLAAGTLDLKTNDLDGVNQTLLATNMAPGDTMGPETITLKNIGSVAGSTLDLAFSYINSDGSPNLTPISADDTAAMIEVTTLTYAGSSILPGDGTNANGWIDIQDLAEADLSGQSGIASQSSEDFEITVQLRSETNGDYQYDGIVVTMQFTLNQ
ncbi:TasA family protein [Chloroflexota bacterium]